jgi:CheY-like chemotaxis protein
MKELSGKYIFMTKIKNCCIIDDDVLFTMVTQKMLQVKDFTEKTITFKNGQEAIDYLIDFKDNASILPDVIFLDINMPVLDGWEFLDELKSLHFAKEIKIFLLTSSINPADIEKAKDYNKVSGYLNKPLNFSEVSSLLMV